MIEISPEIKIEKRDIQFIYVRSSGPGGQNVNKVSSAVQLRFNTETPSLPDIVRQRLKEIAGKRINKEGQLTIEASQYRTQEQNRQDAIQRLGDLIREAAKEPKTRKETKASSASKQQRLDNKRRRGETKKTRGYSPHPDDL